MLSMIVETSLKMWFDVTIIVITTIYVSMDVHWKF